MKKPDRFANMATMLRLEYQASPWIDDGNKWAALEQRVEKLLRRQHAAYVRILRTVLRDEMYDTENYRRLRAAILAAFARDRKGKP